MQCLTLWARLKSITAYLTVFHELSVPPLLNFVVNYDMEIIEVFIQIKRNHIFAFIII